MTRPLNTPYRFLETIKAHGRFGVHMDAHIIAPQPKKHKAFFHIFRHFLQKSAPDSKKHRRVGKFPVLRCFIWHPRPDSNWRPTAQEMDPVHIFPINRDKENAVISRLFSMFSINLVQAKSSKNKGFQPPIVCTLFAKARNLALAKSSIPVET